MTIEEIELKPCPFCGGKAEIKKIMDLPRACEWLYVVYCHFHDCPAKPSVCFETLDGAVAAWNRRAR